MADKKSLYEAAVEAKLNPPAYEDITGKQLEELLESGKPFEGDTDQNNDSDAAKPSGLVVTNLRKNPVRIATLEIEPNGSVTLTDAQQADERLMAKITHGVKTGVYSIG